MAHPAAERRHEKRCRQSADPDGCDHHPVAGRVQPQCIAGEYGHERHEGKAENAECRNDDDQCPRPTPAEDMAEPLPEGGPQGSNPGSRGDWDLHSDQARDHCQVARRIGEEACREAQRGDENAGEGGADHPGEIECARPKGNGIHQIFPIHDLGHERLPRRHLEGGEKSKEHSEPHHPLHRDEIQGGEHPQGERLEQHQALQHQDELPLVHPVRDDPPVE